MLRHAIDSRANSPEKDKVNARNISGECQEEREKMPGQSLEERESGRVCLQFRFQSKQ